MLNTFSEKKKNEKKGDNNDICNVTKGISILNKFK